MKQLKALAVLALAVLVTAPAFAETQSVKVSGALDAYWFYRQDFDLVANNEAGSVPVGTAVPAVNNNTANLANNSDGDDYFMGITQVQVAADLTDNVSTVINLVNMRDWNADVFNNASTGATPNNTGAEFDVDLDLAYVQMKEIFYSPLTLTVGRQDLLFGRGFIVGWNPQDPNTSIQADEFTAVQSFDALRATLDFNPWTIDLVYSNIYENSHNTEDDRSLWVANVNYKFAEYNAVAEGYLVSEIDRATLSAVLGSGQDDNDTHTLGGRVQFDPISQITLGAEVAYQFGQYSGIASENRDRAALGVDLFGTYRWDNTWKPEVTLEYVHLSGEDNVGTGTNTDYNAWNSLYRGKFWTAIADFREFLYATGDARDQSATTNQNLFQVKGALKPLEDLLLEGAFSYLWTDENVHTVAGDQNSGTLDEQIGYEIDLQATYDYTEDVTFGLLTGWFVPGDFYRNPEGETAVDIVSSVKVTF